MLHEGIVKFPFSWTEELSTEFIFVKILDVSMVCLNYADVLSLFMRVCLNTSISVVSLY